MPQCNAGIRIQPGIRIVRATVREPRGEISDNLLGIRSRETVRLQETNYSAHTSRLRAS